MENNRENTKEPILFDYDSTSSFIEDVIDYKKKRNPSLSIRSIAKKIDMSSSSLSDFIRKKSQLSPENAIKIADYLQFDSTHVDYFLTLLIYESCKSGSRKILQERLKNIRGEKLEFYNKRVSELIQSTEISREYIYYLPGTSTFRKLLLLRDKKAKGAV
ncbi:MAG: helix-turn-helix domain-containing protein, partial [Pseudomonadota bacterium]